VNAGRPPVNAGRALEDASRAPEDNDGATVDPGRAPARPSSFKKNHNNLQSLHLFVLKPFPFPSYPVLHKDFSENHHELLFWNNRYYIK
jgi:hypothetical protein